MSFVVPVDPTASDYEQEVVLGETTYRMRLTHNSRDDAWYLSLFGASGEALVLGVRVRLEEPVLGAYVGPDLPDGLLVVADPEGDRVEPGRSGLSDDIKMLLFMPTAELG